MWHSNGAVRHNDRYVPGKGNRSPGAHMGVIVLNSTRGTRETRPRSRTRQTHLCWSTTPGCRCQWRADSTWLERKLIMRYNYLLRWSTRLTYWRLLTIPVIGVRQVAHRIPGNTHWSRWRLGHFSIRPLDHLPIRPTRRVLTSTPSWIGHTTPTPG